MFCLKSNMDRFIVAFTNPRTKMITGLKSNMDRFIAFDIETTSFYYEKFKIQYG